MPNDLRLRVGAVVAILPLGGTDQQVADALRRFARSLGITSEGTPQEQLTAILEHFRDDVKRRSKAVQTEQKRAEGEAAIAAIVDADNAL